MKIPVTALALLAVASVSAAQQPDDPFDEFSQAADRAEAVWQEKSRDLFRRLDGMPPCHIKAAIVEVEGLMKAAFAAKREYLSQWQRLMQSRISDTEKERLAIPAQKAKLSQEAARAHAIMADATRRRDALLEAGHAKTSDEVKAAQGLIDATTREEQENKKLAEMLDVEAGSLSDRGKSTRVVIDSLAKRMQGTHTEETAWLFHYRGPRDLAWMRCPEKGDQ